MRVRDLNERMGHGKEKGKEEKTEEKNKQRIRTLLTLSELHSIPNHFDTLYMLLLIVTESVHNCQIN